MATIRSLQIVLGARTTAFDRKMNKAAIRVRKFAVGIGRLAKRLTQFGAVAIGAAVAGLTVLVKQAFASIDAMAKLSDRIGITTEDLSRLGFAAEIMGVDAASMNKALEIFVRRLGEARQGIGEAKDALTRLNLNINDRVKLSPAEAMALISDRLSQLRTSADKAATAYQLFGRQGQAILNLLNLSATEFRALTAEADKLGLTFSRVDAARIEEANDAITRMKALFKGAAQTIAINVAPAITNIIGKVIEWAVAGEGASAKVIRAMAVVVKAIGSVIEVIDRARLAFVKLEQFAASRNIARFIVKDIEAVREGLASERMALEFAVASRPAEFANVVDALNAQADAIVAASAKISEQGIGLREITGGVGTFQKIGDAINRSLVGGIQRAIDKFNDLKSAADEVRKRLTGFADSLKSAIETPLEELRRNLLDLRKAFSSGIGDLTREQFERGAKFFLDQAKQSLGNLAADPGQFRVLTQGVSAAALTIGAGEQIQSKQLTTMEEMVKQLTGIESNTKNSGVPQ